eukprot:CAMPEP_0172454116 /NCGR_PEP_ID=MMETSP1065-20121228/11194_1 /TAXON_ID=265537 /ORGANISM="Amphiprora paludosa, Strain CCMP125" /LENGTH=431 /DNA_ID=CAMNT_0013206393 /DNA_START=246 /DNA_END=1541 /DNA_ORIENTATION=+
MSSIATFSIVEAEENSLLQIDSDQDDVDPTSNEAGSFCHPNPEENNKMDKNDPVPVECSEKEGPEERPEEGDDVDTMARSQSWASTLTPSSSSLGSDSSSQEESITIYSSGYSGGSSRSLSSCMSRQSSMSSAFTNQYPGEEEHTHLTSFDDSRRHYGRDTSFSLATTQDDAGDEIDWDPSILTSYSSKYHHDDDDDESRTAAASSLLDQSFDTVHEEEEEESESDSSSSGNKLARLSNMNPPAKSTFDKLWAKEIAEEATPSKFATATLPSRFEPERDDDELEMLTATEGATSVTGTLEPLETYYETHGNDHTLDEPPSEDAHEWLDWFDRVLTPSAVAAAERKSTKYKSLENRNVPLEAVVENYKIQNDTTYFQEAQQETHEESHGTVVVEMAYLPTFVGQQVTADDDERIKVHPVSKSPFAFAMCAGS